jgi:hypothetical protein
MRRWTDQQLEDQAQLHRTVSRRIGCGEDCIPCNQYVVFDAHACRCWHTWVYGGMPVPKHACMHVLAPARAA